MPPPPPSTFNGLDWTFLLLLVLSTVMAFLRGIIKVGLSLVGLVAGAVVAAWYYQPLAQLLLRIVPELAIAQVAAFLLLSAGVMVAFTVLANALRRSVHVVGLGLLDRLLGGAFGFARGCLAGSILMMALAAFLPTSASVRDSRLAPYFLAGAHAVCSVVPESFQQQVFAGASQLLREAPESMRARPLTQKEPRSHEETIHND